MVVLTVASEVEILKCDPESESYLTVLSYGAVDYVVQDGSDF